MSNKIKFYPFRSNADPHGVRFVPYDTTQFELKAIRDDFDAEAVFSHFKLNTEGYIPVYNPGKTYTEQLQELNTKLGYWPAPITHKYVYEDIPIEYDDDESGWTKESSVPNFKHRWEMEEFKHFDFPPKDDEVPV